MARLNHTAQPPAKASPLHNSPRSSPSAKRGLRSGCGEEGRGVHPVLKHRDRARCTTFARRARISRVRTARGTDTPSLLALRPTFRPEAGRHRRSSHAGRADAPFEPAMMVVSSERTGLAPSWRRCSASERGSQAARGGCSPSRAVRTREIRARRANVVHLARSRCLSTRGTPSPRPSDREREHAIQRMSTQKGPPRCASIRAGRCERSSEAKGGQGGRSPPYVIPR
jgi:hypothetical protein